MRCTRVTLLVSVVLLLQLPGARASTPAPAANTPARHHHPYHAARQSKLGRTVPMRHAAAALANAYGGVPVDVLTYHYDGGRTGWNQSETDLTPASVASGQFGLLTTLPVDGNVFAQPLQVSGFLMADHQLHDVLIVATGHNSVYAFDAQTYAILWQVNLGPAQATADIGCADVQPEYGITSTPVIIRASANNATIYVVSATEPSPMSFQSQLHALDLRTGAERHPAATIAPAANLPDGTNVNFDPRNQWVRAGLAAGNRSIYVAIGSHCDNSAGASSGWLLRYDYRLNQTASFHSIATYSGFELASIWMSGFAPALDGRGFVFAATGNGEVSATEKDWGESIISLPPSLSSVRSHFTPAVFATLNANDGDLGSGGVMLIPPVAGQTAPPMAVAMGKSPTMFLLNQQNLGGLHKGDTGALQSVSLSGQGVWGGPAYFNGQNGPTVFVQTDNDVLRSFSLATTGTPALTPQAVGATQAGFGGSLPIVSSNGSAPYTGIVWLIRRTAPTELEAYDAEQLGAPIYAASSTGSWSNPDGNNPFLTPMVANGRVYVPGYLGVDVYGLAP